MPERYFLYYEEVDWAQMRGDLPLRLCPQAIVYHHGGTSIGSGRPGRAPSAFSNYFNYRNRLRFLARWRPWALPTAYIFAWLKILQLATGGAGASAVGALRGLHQLAPPRAVADRLSPDAHLQAFGRNLR